MLSWRLSNLYDWVEVVLNGETISEVVVVDVVKFARLRQIEYSCGREENGSRDQFEGQSSSMSSVQCYYCKRYGHKEDRCWNYNLTPDTLDKKVWTDSLSCIAILSKLLRSVCNLTAIAFYHQILQHGIKSSGLDPGKGKRWSKKNKNKKRDRERKRVLKKFE